MNTFDSTPTSQLSKTNIAFRLLRRMAHPIRLTYSSLFPGTTKFEGEFGHECLSIIPYAYYLHQNNLLKKTISASDTQCLYYFSTNHQELSSKRYCEKSISPLPVLQPNHADTKSLHWTPPPFKEIYRGTDFGFDKPILVIANKYNSEWDHAPINYFDLDMLENMIERLRQHYQIIYNRYTVEDDNSKVFELGDFDFLRMKFKDVLLMQDLLKEYPQWTFNELQMRVYAECSHFISVQGGASILCSYFGGKNAIYAKKGFELISGEYENLYPLLSSSQIYYIVPEEKIQTIRHGKLLIPFTKEFINNLFLDLVETHFNKQ